MENQKRFQKKSLNSNDYRAAEQGAKTVKRIFGTLGALFLVIANKDKLKALGAGAKDIAEKIVKK